MVWVYRHPLAGIVGLSPTQDMNVYLLTVLCVIK